MLVVSCCLLAQSICSDAEYFALGEPPQCTDPPLELSGSSPSTWWKVRFFASPLNYLRTRLTAQLPLFAQILLGVLLAVIGLAIAGSVLWRYAP